MTRDLKVLRDPWEYELLTDRYSWFYHSIFYVNLPLYILKWIYYMAPSHKDWELPNSRIWLAELDIDRGLDFPI